MQKQYWAGAPGMAGYRGRPAMGNPGYGRGMPPPGGYNSIGTFARPGVPGNSTSVDSGLLGLADLISNRKGGTGGAYPGILNDPGMELLMGQQRARSRREVDKVALTVSRSTPRCAAVSLNA